MKALKFIGLWIIALMFFGCDRNITPSLLSQIKDLKVENQQLDHKVNSLEDENRQLTGQVDTLSGLDVVKRKQAIPSTEKISLAKRSGFLDKDNDGVREKLVVYLSPYDSNNDVFKAAGEVSIQLWELDETSAQPMLNEWTVTPEELSKLWNSSFTSSYYRFLFDIDTNAIIPDIEYTLKVTFTDYVSGKVLTAQKAIIAN